MGRLALLLTGLLLVSCASGNEEEENDNIFPDSSVRPIIDASTRIDAPSSSLPDGGFPTDGFLCDDHGDCTEAGTCCWLNPVVEMFFCAPGMVEPITMLCIPDFN